MDADKILLDAIRDGIRDGVKQKLSGYNSALDKLVEETIAKHRGELTALLEESITAAIQDTNFREMIRQAVNHNLAKTLVQRFGGEIEKQVNVLKSDPTTRARITLAIEQIVKDAGR